MPLRINFDNSDFLRNDGGSDAIAIANTNSELNLNGCTFEDNISSGRGSIFFLDRTASKVHVSDSTFSRNEALRGGVAYSHALSSFIADRCKFIMNNAFEGGVVYINDEGSIKFTDIEFKENSAVTGNSLLFVNTNSDSSLINIKLSKNIFKKHTFKKQEVQTIVDAFEPREISVIIEKSSVKLGGIYQIQEEEKII